MNERIGKSASCGQFQACRFLCAHAVTDDGVGVFRAPAGRSLE